MYRDACKKPKDCEEDILEDDQTVFIDRTKMKLTVEILKLNLEDKDKEENLKTEEKLSFEEIQIEGASAENNSEIFKVSKKPSNVEKFCKKPLKNALKKTNFKKKLEATNFRGKITNFFKPTSGGKFRVSAVGNLFECAIPGPNTKQSNGGWGADQNTTKIFVTDQSGEVLETKTRSHDSFEGGVTWDWTEGGRGTPNGPIRTGVTEFSEFLDRTVRDLTNGGVAAGGGLWDLSIDQYDLIRL